jgi:hypothetical protein
MTFVWGFYAIVCADGWHAVQFRFGFDRDGHRSLGPCLGSEEGHADVWSSAAECVRQTRAMLRQWGEARRACKHHIPLIHGPAWHENK